MTCRKDSKESLKNRFEKALDSIWETTGNPRTQRAEQSSHDGNPLPEEILSELPKAPLSKEQLDSTKDPLDLLIEKEEGEK